MITEGSLVRLKSGSPKMTVLSINLHALKKITVGYFSNGNFSQFECGSEAVEEWRNEYEPVTQKPLRFVPSTALSHSTPERGKLLKAGDDFWIGFDIGKVVQVREAVTDNAVRMFVTVKMPSGEIKEIIYIYNAGD